MPVIALILSSVMAGCHGPSVEEPPFIESPPLSTLEDLAECSHTYPDGAAVDCTADVAVPATPAMVDGWTCVDEVQQADGMAWLWTDRNGTFGVRYSADASEKATVGVEVTIRSRAGENLTLATGPGTAWFDLAGAHGTAGTWSVAARSFASDANVSSLQDATLDVRVTGYEGSGWYLWALVSDNATYFHQKMGALPVGGETRYVPLSYREEGQDFRWDGNVEEHLLAVDIAYDLEAAVAQPDAACPSA